MTSPSREDPEAILQAFIDQLLDTKLLHSEDREMVCLTAEAIAALRAALRKCQQPNGRHQWE
jgi:hypothetical protein